MTGLFTTIALVVNASVWPVGIQDADAIILQWLELFQEEAKRLRAESH